MDGYATPAEAAMHSMPVAITHVIECYENPGSESAHVLLAVEVAGVGFYLDHNLPYRADDGSWMPGDSVGGGFTDRSLADLRASPPPPGLH